MTPWPNPDAPGVPLNPERDGEHVMEVMDQHGRVWHEVWKWDARTAGGNAVWFRPNFTGPVYGYEPRDLTAPIYSNIRYVGPLPSPPNSPRRSRRRGWPSGRASARC